MTTGEGAIAGLQLALSLEVLPFLGIGALFGLVIGVLPGLSGHFAMAMAVTFLYAMEPAPGLAFLLAAHATVAQGGGLTAILFSTPGTGQNAATLLDGPAMRDRGEAGVAVGAAMTACFMGATFGAIVLAALIPALREVVLLFGPQEIFMLVVVGLVFVAVLGRRDLVRSLIAGLLGLLLALVGTDNATNAPRFDLGLDALRDGFGLVPTVLGLFAIAEMIAIWQRGGALNPSTSGGRARQAQIFRGIGLAIRHWWLVIRCSAIGTTMGVIPGLGSAAASFVAYGHARHTSSRPETFETGNVEGVIAPEAANDAVEGGALASTVAFGIPGSSSMAILLSGLLILGLETGPRMLSEGLDLLFLMIFTIIFGNLIGTLCGMFLANPLMRVTALPGRILAPLVLAVVVSGAYAKDLSLLHVGVAIGFGALGYLLSLMRYSRAAFLIGFVLGGPFEYNLNLALLLGGPGFMFEPVPLVLGMLALAFLAVNVAAIARDRRRTGPSPTGKLPPEARKDPATAVRLLRVEQVFLAGIGVITLGAIYESLFVGRGSPLIPMAVLAPLAALTALQAIRARGFRLQALRTAGTTEAAAPPHTAQALRPLAAALLAMPLAILVAGHYLALFGFVFATTRLAGGRRHLERLAIAGVATTALFLIFDQLLGIQMFQGLIARYFLGYADFASLDLPVDPAPSRVGV